MVQISQAADSAAGSTFAQTVTFLEDRYTSAYLASFFKNANRCRELNEHLANAALNAPSSADAADTTDDQQDDAAQAGTEPTGTVPADAIPQEPTGLAVETAIETGVTSIWDSVVVDTTGDIVLADGSSNLTVIEPGTDEPMHTIALEGGVGAVADIAAIPGTGLVAFGDDAGLVGIADLSAVATQGADSVTVILLTEQDELEGRESKQLVEAMWNGLMRYSRERDGENMDAMEQQHYWHPDFHWMGPSGIGSTHSIEEFQDFHQRPWLSAFGDRNLDVKSSGRNMGFLGEGLYAAGGIWNQEFSMHHGEYQGVPATGKLMRLRDFDWYKRNGNRLIQNWIPIDLIDLFIFHDIDERAG